MSNRRQPTMPPPTADERLQAGIAAAAIQEAIANPATAGERVVAHVDLSSPRRGVTLATWRSLPGLTFDVGHKTYSHALLPGWEYSIQEMRTEMIQDLERLADYGERPTSATAAQR